MRARIALICLAGLATVAQSEEFRCVSLQYPPLVYQSMSGKVEGLALDLVNAALRPMGHSVSVEIYPWARSLSMMQSSERDCIFTIFRSPEREAFLDFNQQSIIPQVVYFYARKGYQPRFAGDLAAVGHLHIGTVNKVNYGPKFEQARPRLMLEEVGTLEQNFKKLALGRLDLVPCNMYTASYTMNQPDARSYTGQLIKLETPLDVVPSYIAFAKERKLQVMLARFDVEFKKVQRSGLYRQLLEKYDIEITPELQQYLKVR